MFLETWYLQTLLLHISHFKLIICQWNNFGGFTQRLNCMWGHFWFIIQGKGVLGLFSKCCVIITHNKVLCLEHCIFFTVLNLEKMGINLYQFLKMNKKTPYAFIKDYLDFNFHESVFNSYFPRKVDCFCQ